MALRTGPTERERSLRTVTPDQEPQLPSRRTECMVGARETKRHLGHRTGQQSVSCQVQVLSLQSESSVSQDECLTI